MAIDVITVTINKLMPRNVHNAIKILLKVLQINDMKRATQSILSLSPTNARKSMWNKEG